VAVAFDAAGPSAAGASIGDSVTLSWTHTIGGGVSSGAVLAAVAVTDSTADSMTTTVTCGGTAMTSLGKIHCNNQTLGYIEVFGLATGGTTGAQTILATSSASSNGHEGGSLSFSGVSQSAPFATAVTAAGATTPATATSAGSISGNLLAAFAAAGSGITSATSPSTSRFLSNGNSGLGAAGSCAGATSPATGSNVTMAWTIGADWWGEVLVQVLAAGAAPPPPPPALLTAPGWFPGSAAVTDDPGGIPFYPQPAPFTAPPAVIVPPLPEAAPLLPPPLPPGWFPGADKATTQPGGIPFYAQPQPQTPAPAVIFPVPEVAGIVQWLPWPPNYFPGSQAVSVDPGGIPFYSQPQPLTPPPAPPPVPVITGTGGTGAGYFRDQNGNPRFLLGDEAWGLLANAGAWSGGNWQSTIGSYLAARAAQGFTSMVVSALSFAGAACVNTNGNDWDNVTPWVSGGDPSTGLNNAFWARRDYLLITAAGLGITVFLNPAFNLAFDTVGTALHSLTTTQWQDYGTSLGNRYRNFANLLWLIGDDYFGGSFDSNFDALLTGLRGAGDTHAISIQNYQETTSRKDLFDGSATPWGVSNAQFNWVYSYNFAYDGIEKAHLEASPLPLARGDGSFIVAGDHADLQLQRSHAWWALSSGARGYNTGDENVWRWTSGSMASATSDVFYADGTARNIRAAFESLTGWHLLIPDTSSQLVTAGRGTHGSPITSGGGGTAYTGTSDAYVTASRTPNGSLAVIYMSHASTITVDQSKLAPGYTATWIDPASGAATAGTPGTTYNSGAQGSNSAGDPDWVLVLQGTPSRTRRRCPCRRCRRRRR